MALVKCAECGREVSNKAPACLGCGAPIGVVQVAETRRVAVHPGDRECLRCRYVGSMKTWLRNYNEAQLILLVLFFFWVVPALIFAAAFWGKYKCPACGKVGANHLLAHDVHEGGV